MQIHSTHTNFVPKNTLSQLIHTGRGFIHGIIASVDTAGGGSSGTLTLYDSTAASGNILIRLNLHTNAPLVIQLDRVHALKFETGLTAAASAYVDAFILTEF